MSSFEMIITILHVILLWQTALQHIELWF